MKYVLFSRLYPFARLLEHCAALPIEESDCFSDVVTAALYSSLADGLAYNSALALSASHLHKPHQISFSELPAFSSFAPSPHDCKVYLLAILLFCQNRHKPIKPIQWNQSYCNMCMTLTSVKGTKAIAMHGLF